MILADEASEISFFSHRPRQGLSSSRGADVDADSSVGPLLKVNEELRLEDTRDQRITLLGAAAVESEPVISKVRQTDASDGDERDSALESRLSSTLNGLGDEDVDRFVGLER